MASVGRTMRSRAYSTLRLALATLLLVAALLKGHELATEPVAGGTIFDSRPWLVGVVQGQLFLGIWLAANVYPRTVKFVTLAVFFAFACVSAYKVLSGADSCGCFGKANVDPRWTLAAVVTLLYVRPPP